MSSSSATIPVLVTGATGFVGMRLAEMLLDRGTAVRVLVRDPDRLNPRLRAGCEIAVGDLARAGTLAAAVTGVSRIYHCAANIPWSIVRPANVIGPQGRKKFTVCTPLAKLDHMPATEKQAKRPYLSKPNRRLALLDVAADLVERRGWPALTMISLADAAQVSRQLVYQHFASVDDLMAETITHLFRHSYETMRRHIANPELGLTELLRIAEEQTFNDRPERVQALWEMMILSDTQDDEAAKVSRRLRHLLIKLWAPPIQRHSGLSEKQSRAMAWMLNMAFWGAHQMVEEGEISRKAATELCTQLVRQLDPPAGADS